MTTDGRLAAAWLALLLVSAGCLAAPGTGIGTGTETEADGEGDSTARYDAYVFDHGDAGRPAVEGGIRYGYDEGAEPRHYVTLVRSPAEADRFDRTVLDDGAAAFVDATSFDRSYLLVIQAFPASSTPDYRVERIERSGDRVRAFVNDSSRGGTADVTVETVLVRVRRDGDAPPERATVTTEDGYTFTAAAGVVTRTPRPPSPEPDRVTLPYASANASENVADPRDVRVRNGGDATNGYALTITYTEVPACRAATPPCGEPEREVTVLERREKLRSGASTVIEDVAAKRGTYVVAVAAQLPAGDGSRRTVTESFEWRVDDRGGDLAVTITADGVTVDRTAASDDGRPVG